jgi:hypothetical protein
MMKYLPHVFGKATCGFIEEKKYGYCFYNEASGNFWMFPPYETVDDYCLTPGRENMSIVSSI